MELFCLIAVISSVSAVSITALWWMVCLAVEDTIEKGIGR